MNDVNSPSSDTLTHADRSWRWSPSAAARSRLRPAVAVVLLAAIAGLAWLYFAHRGAAETEAEAKPTAQVETVPLQREAIAQTLEAFGVVEAAPAADRTTPATYESVVAAIHAVPGAHVNVGDVVMEIAPSPDAKLQYESARTTLKLRVEPLEKAPRVAVAVKSCSCSARDAAHGGDTAVVAVRQFLQRSALRAPSDGLFLLCRCQGRGTPHGLPLSLSAAPAFGGAGAD